MNIKFLIIACTCIALPVSVIILSPYRVYSANKPDSKIVGRYAPQDYNEKHILETSEIDIFKDHKCKLIDFHVIDSVTALHISYHTEEGSWGLEDYAGNWLMVLKLRNESASLRMLTYKSLLENEGPYMLCQEGEDIDDDSLIFTQK